jgi:predicted ATP-grasp superfamily ATP-dependent carboligase
MPMTEGTLLPLSRERAQFEAVGARFVLPAHERVLEACSKTHTTRLAEHLGIAVPRTWNLDNDPATVMRLAPDLPYPVVLKPATSFEHAHGTVSTTGAPVYARNPDELIEAWRDLTRRASSILIQEFVVGRGAGYFALMRHGVPLVEFAHRRIRDVRPTGSGSAVRESVAMDARIRTASRRMLAALQWHGVAMVEYRIRPDGEPVFLEVNGRFWNSLPLAIAAGVDFPRLLVELGTKGSITTQPAYREGVRCRWWLGDFRHLLQVWRGAPAGYPVAFPSRMATLRDFVMPQAGTVHDNFTLSDPLPELGDWLHFFGRKLPRHFARSGAPSTKHHAPSTT